MADEDDPTPPAAPAVAPEAVTPAPEDAPVGSTAGLTGEPAGAHASGDRQEPPGAHGSGDRQEPPGGDESVPGDAEPTADAGDGPPGQGAQDINDVLESIRRLVAEEAQSVREPAVAPVPVVPAAAPLRLTPAQTVVRQDAAESEPIRGPWQDTAAEDGTEDIAAEGEAGTQAEGEAEPADVIPASEDEKTDLGAPDETYFEYVSGDPGAPDANPDASADVVPAPAPEMSADEADAVADAAPEEDEDAAGPALMLHAVPAPEPMEDAAADDAGAPGEAEDGDDGYQDRTHDDGAQDDGAYDDGGYDDGEAGPPYGLHADDEAALRIMVGQIIRDELQGELGAVMTRNLRRLVRQEIARALNPGVDDD